MDFWKPLLGFLATEATAPEAYGLYHIVWLALIAGLTVFAVLQGRKHNAETVNRVVFLTAVVVFALEIYKQFVFTFGDGSGEASYSWYAFPFQFCSTPMYIGLIAAVTKNEALHRRLCAYLASYSLFAGISVMAYPVSVFTDTVGINIQTMVWHGGMIAMGIVLLRTGYVRASLGTVIQAFPVFLTLVTAAAVMNELAHRTGLLATETFNMFFISPYCAPSLPVYSMIQPHVTFPVSVLVYVAGFTAAAMIVLLLCRLAHIDAPAAKHHPFWNFRWRLAH